MSQRWTKVRNIYLPIILVVGFMGSLGLLYWHHRSEEIAAQGHDGVMVKVRADKIRAREKMVYLRVLPDGGQCVDGSPVQAQIQINGDQGILLRDECKAVPPGQQKPVAFTFHSADDRVIVYNGKNLSLFDWELVFLTKDSNDNLYTFGQARSPGFPKDEPKIMVQVISKLNSEGKVLWSKFIPSYLNLREAKAMPSGEMVFIGYTRADESAAIKGETQIQTPSHIFLLNPEGQPLWSRSYMSGFVGMFGTGITALETDSQGSIYVAGLHKDESGASYNLLMKLDHDGNTVWQKRLAVSAIEGLKLAPDGGLFVYGGSKESGGGLLVQLDPSGNMQRARIFGAVKIWSLGVANNGRLVLSGVTENKEGETKPFVASVSSGGRLEWAKNFVDKRYAFESPFLSYVTTAVDGTAYVVSTVLSQAGEVGRILKISENWSQAKEFIFYSSAPPASILSEAIIGRQGDVWTIARRTPEAMPPWLSYMGLLHMHPLLPQPCVSCFVVDDLVGEDIVLKTAPGAASLDNVTVELDRKWLDLNLADSPIPVPIW